MRKLRIEEVETLFKDTKLGSGRVTSNCLPSILCPPHLHPSTARRRNPAHPFYFFLFYFLTLQYCIVFSIYQHESATGIHVFPILNPPPSPYVPVHQPQASSIASTPFHRQVFKCSGLWEVLLSFQPSPSWFLLVFQDSSGVIFPGNFSRLPLSKVWYLFSGFPQPWARVLCLTVLISTCHSVLICSRSWAISYSILELQSFVERLCEAGIKWAVLVGWTNDQVERSEAKGLFQDILWSQKYSSSSPNLIVYQPDQLQFSKLLSPL